MSVSVHIPVISPRLAAEYFFLCSRRPELGHPNAKVGCSG